MTDYDLLIASQADDENALKTIYNRYWKILYTKACKRVNEDEASDMIQDVIISFWSRRHHLSAEKEGFIGQYLFTALKYRIISHYAYTTVQIKNAALLEPALGVNPEDLLESKELRMVLEKAIGKMPGKMQLIFRMSRQEDISISEIAVNLKISEQTVKNQLGKALKRLRLDLLQHQTSLWVLILMNYLQKR